MRQSTKILAALLLLGYLWTSAEGMAVMSVDLGNEFMKIAIVKPGVPMEIVLNKESRRKTPVAVAFRNNEREFGDQAMNTAVRYPANAFLYLKDLLGKKVDNPVVKHYQQRFPYHNIVPSDTGTVMFQIDENTKYSVEELLGMVLQEAKHLAEGFAEQPISDVVITVPPFFNQAERRAMNLAAEYAGLKLLQLMNDNSAVALNYGVFRRKEFNGTAQHYMFFDMGATSTIVTIVGYQLVKTKEGSYTETNPQVTVKGVGFDRDLGGLEFQLRFRDHLARLFNSQKKTSTDVFQDKRAMGKLFKEAGRVKNVLSANTDHFAQVESLLDDQDFKAKVTREELEEMSQDMLDRVAKPIEDALKVSQMTMGEIKEVILMGGGTRMPKVQELISKATGRQELGKSINTDEAAALGAVYQAAFLSKGYRVKKFLVKDANLYPIQVEFERQKEGEAVKTIKRTLFGRMNPYPQKKVMTFNKHTEDFNFRVNYGDLSYLEEVDVKNFDSLNLTKVTLKGVKAAHEKHSKDAESKGVKAHFRMDESGILTLDRVESVYEKAPPPEEESTLAKLGNTISNFFSGKSEEEGNVEDSKEKDDKGKENGGEKSTDSKDDTSEDKKEKKQSDKAKEEEKEKKEEKTENKKDTKAQKEEVKNEKKEEKADQKKDETPKEGKADKGEQKGNETTDKKDGDAAKNETAEEKKPPKPVTIKEEITPESEILDLLPPSEDAVKASIKVLEKLKQKDEDKIKLQQAHNALESFIFDAQDKLYQEPYEQASTEEERSMLREKLTAASDWLDESDVTNTIQEFKDQLKTLKDATKALYERVREHSERPKALEALKDMLNYTDMFYKGVKNLTESLEDQPYTEVEVTTLEKLINETKSWQKTNVKAQKDTPLTDKPVLLVEDIAVKIRALDREVKYLMNKAKTFVPKKPVKPKNETETPGNETKIETPNNETKSEEEGPAEGQADSTTPSTEEPVEQPPPPTEEENKNKEEKLELPESEETDKTGKEDKSSESKETDSKKDDEHIEL